MTGLSLRFGHGLRAATIWAFLRRALATWTPRLIGLLIALELGLLSPLSCVIHCFVQQLLAERPTIGFFLCGEHSLAPVATPADHRVDPFTRPAPDPSSSPASTITPRALYELVALASPLLTVVSLLVAVLLFLPARRLVPQILPPPNPAPHAFHWPELTSQIALRASRGMPRPAGVPSCTVKGQTPYAASSARPPPRRPARDGPRRLRPGQ